MLTRILILVRHSPVVTAPKPKTLGEFRIVIESRYANSQLQPAPYLPLPGFSTGFGNFSWVKKLEEFSFVT
jgi:hypothetical protein